jgi:hypothetical protein
MRVEAEFRKTAYATVPKSEDDKSCPSHPLIEFNLNEVDEPVIDSDNLLLGTVVGLIDAIVFILYLLN